MENCRRRVEDDADIFVLVVGGRYGSVAEEIGKSVTNLEYEVARVRRIPIYAFIQSEVLAILPIWEANPGADFSGTVDNPRLFEFIKNLRSIQRVWANEFRSAQDIVGTLRLQFAYLMRSGLQLQQQTIGRERELRQLAGNALRLAIEKPSGWQGKLFAQVVIDELDHAHDLKRAYDSGLSVGFGDRVGPDDASVGAWIRGCTQEAARLLEGTTKLVNKSLNMALTSDDIVSIAWAGREIGRIYRETIQWAMRIRRAHLPEDWEPLAEQLALIMGDVLTELERLGSTVISAIDEALATSGDDPVKVKLKLVFKLSENVDALMVEIDRMRIRKGPRP